MAKLLIYECPKCKKLTVASREETARLRTGVRILLSCQNQKCQKQYYAECLIKDLAAAYLPTTQKGAKDAGEEAKEQSAAERSGD